MKLNLFSAATYLNRRKELLEQFPDQQILILGNRESSINFKDNWYPFRQDSTLLYYCGLNIADIDIVIDGTTGETILFGDELTIDHIVWTGPLPTLHELAEKVGIDKVLPSSSLTKYLKNTIFLPPYRAEHSIRLAGLLSMSIEKVESSHSISLIEAIIHQRNYKSEEEIESLHEACTYTSRMHLEIMSKARPGMHEYELVSLAKAYGASQNVSFSFQPICTKRGHVLHNHSYDNKINEGDLILFDGGLESDMLYAGDMTRTFPVSTSFTSIQKELYQIVLDAQKAAIRASVPGNRFLDIHLLAAETTVSGLKDMGIMKGNVQEAVAAGAHTMFFQCGLGHMMGLDVHDMENLGERYVGYGRGMIKSKEFGLKSLRLGRALEKGFVITIEPGIYIIPELIDKFAAEKKFLDFIDYDALEKIRNFGGIRIEDDLLITESGNELLGEPLAKEVKDVEAIRTAALP